MIEAEKRIWDHNLEVGALIKTEHIMEATGYIKDHLPADLQSPKLAILCGSGINTLPQLFQAEEAVSIPYAAIPYFAHSAVAGHVNRLLFGALNGVKTVCMLGRFHFYEGHSLWAVTFPVRVLVLLGVEAIIVTNAAGSLVPEIKTGDFMVIDDHVSFPILAGMNPLRGENLSDFGPRFPSLTHIYHPKSVAMVQMAAERSGIPSNLVKKGIYFAVGGPSYETRAELRMMRMLGGTAVGMSTVPEIIVAAHSGIKKLVALSLITNENVLEKVATHEEVLEMAGKSSKDFAKLIEQLAKIILEY